MSLKLQLSLFKDPDVFITTTLTILKDQTSLQLGLSLLKARTSLHLPTSLNKIPDVLTTSTYSIYRPGCIYNNNSLYLKAKTSLQLRLSYLETRMSLQLPTSLNKGPDVLKTTTLSI